MASQRRGQVRSARSDHRRGYAAHENVPPSHWCVLKEDLIKLRKQVKECVERKQIVPSDLDPFDLNDNVYGPCVHTVVNQLLKGVSYMGGGCSWALIQHPEGLECDLYVSHGWAEGIYEFIDKVVYSWPTGTRHAYCCMLSNPQTLDIGDLIASPSDSPFAKALRVASHVLVVPNRQGSIYDRCWCTYEVFLAYKWDKHLTIATPPILGMRRSVSLMLLMHVVCLGISFVLNHYLDLYNIQFLILPVIALLTRLLAALMPDSCQAAHKIVNICGISSVSVYSGAVVHVLTRNRPATAEAVFLVVYWTFVAMFFIFNHIDVMWHRQVAFGRGQLSSGYSGSIRDSKASFEEDKRQILQEIREVDGEDQADETIAVLLKSGMCSKALRMAHELGVDIAGVGVVKTKFISLAWIFYLSQFYPIVYRQNCAKSEVAAYGAAIITSICVVTFILRMSCNLHRKDQRAFIAVATWKMFALPYLLALIVVNSLFYAQCRRSAENLAFVNACIVSPVCCCLATLISMLDLASLASSPVVGVPLATILATSDLRCNCRTRTLHARVASAPMATFSQDRVSIEVATLW